MLPKWFFLSSKDLHQFLPLPLCSPPPLSVRSCQSRKMLPVAFSPPGQSPARGSHQMGMWQMPSAEPGCSWSPLCPPGFVTSLQSPETSSRIFNSPPSAEQQLKNPREGNAAAQENQTHQSKLCPGPSPGDSHLEKSQSAAWATAPDSARDEEGPGRVWSCSGGS